MALSKITNASVADTAVHGRRNHIINGSQQIWQRATSVSAIAAGAYQAVDRWRYWAGVQAMSTTRTAVTAGDATVGQFDYFNKMVVTGGSGASGDYACISTHIEGLNALNGQTVTVSFYGKASAALKVAVEITQQFGTSGSARVYVTPKSVTLGTGWGRHEVTFDVPSISGKTVGSGSNTEVVLWFSGGASFASRTDNIGYQTGTFDITGLQLEVGDTATPFEHRSYGDELQLCRRYFWAMVAKGEATGGAGNTNQKVMGSGYYLSTNQVELPLIFPVEMRTAPTLSSSSGTNHFFIEAAGGNDGFDGWSQFASKKQSALLYRSNVIVSGTGGQSGRIIAASSSAYVYWSAEL